MVLFSAGVVLSRTYVMMLSGKGYRPKTKRLEATSKSTNPYPAIPPIKLFSLVCRCLSLSQSPEKRSQFTIQSAARSSAAAVNTDTNCSMTPKALRSNCDIERPNRGSFSPTGTLNHRQQSNDSRVSNGDDATDSVVLGSRDSTTSAASREGVGAEATCGRARSPVEGMVGVAKTETRDQGGGVRHDRVQKERGNGELYFDPVLNCYYDRAADKYYELC